MDQHTHIHHRREEPGLLYPANTFSNPNHPLRPLGHRLGPCSWAVHGAQSHKEDTPFRLLAETFKNTQILSFDLPEHGERKNASALCKPPVCVRDLSTVMDYAEDRWKHIGLFAVSMWAYFSLLAFENRRIGGTSFSDILSYHTTASYSMQE